MVAGCGAVLSRGRQSGPLSGVEKEAFLHRVKPSAAGSFTLPGRACLVLLPPLPPPALQPDGPPAPGSELRGGRQGKARRLSRTSPPHHSFPPSRSGKRKKKREKKALNLPISEKGATGKEWPRREKSRRGDKGSSVAPVLVVFAAASFRHRIQMDILQLSPAEQGLNA